MLRFMTMEFFAFQTSSTGMPAIGLVGSSWALGFTMSFARAYPVAKNVVPGTTFSGAHKANVIDVDVAPDAGIGRGENELVQAGGCHLDRRRREARVVVRGRRHRPALRSAGAVHGDLRDNTGICDPAHRPERDAITSGDEIERLADRRI